MEKKGEKGKEGKRKRKREKETLHVEVFGPDFEQEREVTRKKL